VQDFVQVFGFLGKSGRKQPLGYVLEAKSGPGRVSEPAFLVRKFAPKVKKVLHNMAKVG
jgi:hypothetical protein